MNTKMTDQQLERFYRILSVPMTDFDCGSYCTPQNNGVPYCCDQENLVPVLFKDEFKWNRKKGAFWEKMPVQTKSDKRLIKDSCSYNIFAMCPGPQNCRRTLRALVCRLFPFEPFLDHMGCVIGLVYQNGENECCSLFGRPQQIYNQTYIRNCIQVWQELVNIFPEEKDMYIRESRKRKRDAARTGKPVRFFK